MNTQRYLGESILSGAAARELIAAAHTDEPWFCTTIERASCHVGFRLCTVLCGPGTTRRLSGGAIVEVRPLRKFDHVTTNPKQTTRLRPGWTERTLSRALCRMFRIAHEYVLLAEQRERVYAKWEPIRARIGLKRIDAIVKRGEVEGHTADYAAMTEADCAYWIQVQP